MSFHDGGCNGVANYGGFGQTLSNNGACYNLAKDKPWDSIVLGLHDGYEVYFYDNLDCCLGTPDDDDQPCAIFHDRQEGTCVQEPIVPKSLRMVSPIHQGASPNGRRGGRNECAQASDPAVCPNDATAQCQLDIFKQIDAACGAGASPCGYASVTLESDQQCNGDNNPSLMTACDTHVYEGHYVLRKKYTNFSNDIDIYVTGTSGKTYDGYFEYYLHGKKQHIDFNTCQVTGGGFEGFAYSQGNRCTFPCDFVNPFPTVDPNYPYGQPKYPECNYAG